MTITKKIDLTSKLDCESELLAVLKNMVVQSKPEQGCMLYELYQEKENLRNFFLIEIWESSDHLDAHKQTPHFINFGLKAPDFLEAKSAVELNSFL